LALATAKPEPEAGELVALRRRMGAQLRRAERRAMLVERLQAPVHRPLGRLRPVLDQAAQSLRRATP
jgi:hypothetical protein